MRKLLNTLFVNSKESYAGLDGENIVIYQEGKVTGRFPLHILESIYLFNYSGASPALIGKCAEKQIDLVFLTPQGKFLARTVGKSNGNVLLRRTQYRNADDEYQSCKIAAQFIYGKLSNARQVLNRTRRDHPLRINEEEFKKASEQIKKLMKLVMNETSLDALRGYEGSAASIYFASFDSMILRNKDVFFFNSRNRRPPKDPMNALLSFVYVILGSNCSSALEMVGLDSYVGFLHRDRPGRTSLGLDLMEELRPCIADRFCLTLINNGIINKNDFIYQENGAVLLSSEGKRKVQKEWHTRKSQQILHPFLNEKIEWGLVPYSQALLLSRYLRGDIESYPPFLWK